MFFTVWKGITKVFCTRMWASRWFIHTTFALLPVGSPVVLKAYFMEFSVQAFDVRAELREERTFGVQEDSDVVLRVMMLLVSPTQIGNLAALL